MNNEAPVIASSDVRQSDSLESMEMRGTIGPYPVGLNYTVKGDTALVAAHYFYVSHLKDIPLKGMIHGGTVDFSGADGSSFHLQFIGKGTDGKPLTFPNSTGFKGVWTMGSRSLPVNLSIEHSTANPGERQYAQVTEQPDAAFEAMVATIRQAILSGDQAATAKLVHYPLRVNRPHQAATIRDAEELRAQWTGLFTPEFLAKLRADVPHEMFVHNGQAMLGDGELWFDGRGLVSLNFDMGNATQAKRK